jgi:hypothetical protein
MPDGTKALIASLRDRGENKSAIPRLYLAPVIMEQISRTGGPIRRPVSSLVRLKRAR